MPEAGARARRALTDAIESVGLQIKPDAHGGRDVLVAVEGKSWRLRPVWIGQGFPRDVERAAASGDLTSTNRNVRSVAIAREMSVGAQAWLRDQEISWADERGRFDIRADPGLVLIRRESTDRLAGTRSSDRPWAEATATLAELLLNIIHHDGQGKLPSVERLAASSGWSPPTVSNALSMFDAEGWTKKQGGKRGPSAARSVVNPAGLLDRWSDWFREQQPPTIHAHTTAKDVQAIAERVERQLPLKAWALSGFAAVDMVAPFATTTPSLLYYVDGPLFDLALRGMLPDMGLMSIEGRRGARVTFARPRDLRDLGARSLHGRRVVSDIRLYADLLKQDVRGEAVAAHLREVNIEF